MISKIRLAFQLFFFIFIFLFIAGIGNNQEILNLINSLHLFPTFSHIPWVVLPSFILVTIFILIVPLIIGRIYCSYLCPVGFLQDLIQKVALKLKIKQKTVRYLIHINLIILGLCLISLFFRTSIYGYFDHYSNFIRLFSIFDHLLTKSGLWALIFLVVIAAVPVIRPRWFCLMICPSGTIYSLLARLSLFDVYINDDCIRCGLCEAKCPTLAIGEGKIEKEKCITCFECLDNCPQNAFKVGFKFYFKRVKESLSSKRIFFAKTMQFLVGVFLFGIHKKTSAIDKWKFFNEVVPPGGKNTSLFLDRCVGCGMCVSVCPTKVLAPDFRKSILTSTMVPVMDYDSSYCSYECNICMSVCPSPALSYLSLRQKKQTKIGSSSLDKNVCIPYVKNQECGACAEHCPSGAIEMKSIGDVMAPVIDTNYCIGCGACQYICPTVPKKAIVVKAQKIHSAAYDPRKKDPKLELQESNEFPF